jgi:hypothetical protein
MNRLPTQEPIKNPSKRNEKAVTKLSKKEKHRLKKICLKYGLTQSDALRLGIKYIPIRKYLKRMELQNNEILTTIEAYSELIQSQNQYLLTEIHNVLATIERLESNYQYDVLSELFSNPSQIDHIEDKLKHCKTKEQIINRIRKISNSLNRCLTAIIYEGLESRISIFVSDRCLSEEGKQFIDKHRKGKVGSFARISFVQTIPNEKLTPSISKRYNIEKILKTGPFNEIILIGKQKKDVLYFSED